MKRSAEYLRVSITYIICLITFLPASAVAGYATLASSGGSYAYHDTVTVTAGDPAYGSAQVEYWAWQETGGEELWHYSYQITNNSVTFDGGGKPGSIDNPPVLDHFGYAYLPGAEPPLSFYNGINKFSLDLDNTQADGPLGQGSGIGPGDLEVYNANSTQGGDPWGNALDPGNIGKTGIDWAVTLGGSGARQIDPTRYYFDDRGGSSNDQWIIDTLGDSSTDDTNGGYFHVVSAWAPDLRWAGLAADGSQGHVTGGEWVMAPAIPEPATCLLLAAGSLLAFSKRRRKT